MTDQSEAIAQLLLKQQIEDFLYHEAELLDERRYEDWLALLADDVRYWMPMRRNVKFGELEREFTRAGQDINWFDEGKDTLTRRVQQILTGVHWAEEPLAVSGSARRGHRQMPLPDLPQPGGNGNRPPGGETRGRPTAGGRSMENSPAQDRSGPERLAGQELDLFFLNQTTRESYTHGAGYTPRRKAVRAAKYPHMPCTPPPGGVEDEQMYSPCTGVAYGTRRRVGRVKSWRRSWTPPLMSPPM